MRERFAKPLEEVQTVFAAHGRLYVWEVVHDGTAVMHEVERADSDKKWKLPNDFRAAIHVPIQERCAILGRFAIFSLPDRFAALDLVTGAVDGEMPCGKPFAQIAWLDHWVGWVRDESRENDWRMQLWIARQPSAPVWKPKAMLLFEADERSEIAPWGPMLLHRRRVYWATRYGAVCSLDLREQSEASQPTELVAPRPKCRRVWFCGEENGVMVIREEGDRAYALRLSSGGPEVELYGLRGPLSAAYVVGNRLIAVGQAVIMYDTTTWQETKRVACPPGHWIDGVLINDAKDHWVIYGLLQECDDTDAPWSSLYSIEFAPVALSLIAREALDAVRIVAIPSDLLLAHSCGVVYRAKDQQ